MYIWLIVRRDSYRPKLHYLCGNNTSHLVIVNATADFKNYHLICDTPKNVSKNSVQTPPYTPKNKNDTLQIIRKYRERILTLIDWKKKVLCQSERPFQSIGRPLWPTAVRLDFPCSTCQFTIIQYIDYRIRFSLTIIESMKLHFIGTVKSKLVFGIRYFLIFPSNVNYVCNLYNIILH